MPAGAGTQASEDTGDSARKLAGPCWIEPSGEIVIETYMTEPDGTASIIRVLFGPSSPSHGTLKRHIESSPASGRDVWCPWPPAGDDPE